MSDIEKDVGELKGLVDSHAKRLDTQEGEIKELRKTKHDHANIIHNHQGILQTIEKSISDLVSATGLSAEATSENTKAISDFKLVVKTALWLIPTASTILICSIPFLKFLNTIYFWW
jgi:chromosome segregation ATPase